LKASQGIQWIPWSELTSTQRITRLVVFGVLGISILVVVKNAILPQRAGGPAPATTQEGATLSDSERHDGIESLCKVFQIYGLPKTDNDVSAAVKNASELFKLSGGETVDRGNYIFQSLANDFRSKKLGGSDCAEAGAPLPTSDDNGAAAEPSP